MLAGQMNEWWLNISDRWATVTLVGGSVSFFLRGKLYSAVAGSEKLALSAFYFRSVELGF